MRLIKIYFVIFLLASCFFFPAFQIHAQNNQDVDKALKGEIYMKSGKGFLDEIVKGEGGYETARVGGNSLIDLIGLITLTLISLLGVFFVIKLIYAGFLWMTASGNEEQVGKSKGIIFSTIIGLAVVLSAFVLSWYVLNKLGSKSMERESTVELPQQ